MASSIVRQPREIRLQELYDRGEHYTLLNITLRLLAENPGNVEAAFFAFRSYTAIGLIGPALEMLEEGGGPLGSLPELAGLRDQLAAIPSGKIAWSSLQQRFEDNAACLYRAHPELRRHDATFRAVPESLELYRTLDGNLQLSEKKHGGARHWLPDLADAKRIGASVKLAHDPRLLFCMPYVVLGDRFGMLFDRVFDGTRKMFLTFTPRIYLLETDIRVFGAMLWAVESMAELCDDRVSILIGPDCVAAMIELMRREPTRAIPDYIVRSPTSDQATNDRLMDAIRELVDARERQALATIASMRNHYDALPASHWAERFAPCRRDKLRILGLTSRFTTVLQYSMRDLKAAFERLGHDFRLLIEDGDHDLLPPARTAEVIEEFHPDLILAIDHLRREYEQVMPANVPFVCWIQDQLPHLVCVDAGQSQGELDFYITPELDPLVRKYAYPAAQGLVWTMATDERLYSSDPMREEDLAAYRCDFSFVSNQSQSPRDFHRQRQERFCDDPGAARLTDCLFETLSERIASDPAAACGTVMTFINEAVRATGIAPASPEVEDRLGRFHAQPLADLMFRQNALEWVADYCDQTGRVLHLYGNGWQDHPRFAKYARGVAKNGPELRAIYQASAINLQINTYGAVHQRLLDGLAAGGFFMIRRCPTDGVREPLTEFLAAVAECGIETDRTYRREDVPRFAAALDGLADQYHEPRQGANLTLPYWRLEFYRNFAAKDYMRVAGAVFADYEQVAFGSREEFVRKASQYLEAAPQRKAIMDTMRAEVVRRFTYNALVGELLAFMGERLATGKQVVSGKV
jgi:hypothetical protein